MSDGRNNSTVPDRLTERHIQAALVGYLRGDTNLVMGNVYVKGSSWESDVIAVTKAFYWHEYEIKLSVADYRNDFQKRISGFSPKSQRKHDVYASRGELAKRYGRLLPRPKSFSFVVPEGLLDDIDVPKHCGIIICRPTKHDGLAAWTQRPAPTLWKPTKLSPSQIFNLAAKVAGRLEFEVER